MNPYLLETSFSIIAAIAAIFIFREFSAKWIRYAISPLFSFFLFLALTYIYKTFFLKKLSIDFALAYTESMALSIVLSILVIVIIIFI